ncbi:hypothetical protein MKX03_036443 [Papaver bracteatum]|nr:hypothetical protein MKX03_036443 [Papaver bracteatum]
MRIMKVKAYVSESMDRSPSEDVGTVGQAFCDALQDELSEYYKLLDVLEVQSVNPIPMVSESTNSGSYLSLRRLLVWFAEPMVKMRLMAVLGDSFKALKGGAMAGAIHMHTQHGDPLVQEFMRRLLHRVCSPLFEMVRSWVLEGEFDDIFSEFFVLGQPVKAESLWVERYRLHSVMLLSFISSVCCEDQGWADAASEAVAAVGTTTIRGGLVYGETDALESLVFVGYFRQTLNAVIYADLMDVIYNGHKFKDHCMEIKRYLLLGQGNFVQYMIDIVGPELSEPANTIISFKLAGLLESMMQHGTGDRGWDVFSLEYDARVPLNTVFSESVMASLGMLNMLLIGSWKTMKPNYISSHFLTKKDCPVKSQFDSTLRRCQVIWDEMNHFVSNLQYYIQKCYVHLLEVSWSLFVEEMEAGEDLDDLLVAHEKYLLNIFKNNGTSRFQTLRETLFVLLDLILRFRSHTDRLYEGIYELQARTMESSLSIRGKNKSKPRSTKEATEFGSWAGGGRKALTQRTGEFLRNMGHELGQLPLQQHVDLKFLLFRLDFTEFYSRLRVST